MDIVHYNEMTWYYFKNFNTEFSVDSIWHSQGNRTTTISPAKYMVFFFKAAKFTLYFTMSVWSTIFVTSRSICANRPSIVSSITQFFFKQHLIKLYFLWQLILHPFRVQKVFIPTSSSLSLATVTDPCSLLYLNCCFGNLITKLVIS